MPRMSAIFSLAIALLTPLSAEKPFRVGTTAANFLGIGYGPAQIAMGGASVSMVTSLAAAYWNPAGLAFMPRNSAIFNSQPWLVDTKLSFAAVGVRIPTIGTMALSIIQMSWGDMEVNTLAQQEGTGEIFDANEIAVTGSFARSITNWFAFGAGLKYVSSQIWHETGSAVAFDFGVQIKTEFFSRTDNPDDGLKIGMSIANYGTRLKYDGTDLLNPLDINPDEHGNYSAVPGQFRLSGWELPLMFRVGISVKPLVTKSQSLVLAVDALHPNNNSESINVGAEYNLKLPAFGSLFIRGGVNAIAMDKTEFGPTFGVGMLMNLVGNTSVSLDYSYRDIGVWDTFNSFAIGFEF